MYSYSTMQWVLFFCVYCFLGWIWESGYVSAKERKWTNRGFMHGPFLPIYGFGAIMILLATIPVKDNLLLIFFMGMIAATILEYFTGAAMERLFHVRYWDYSNQFCNLNGYICLKCSLAWGAFSILMVRFIHVPVERCILWIPDTLEEIIAFVLTLVFVADFALSFREAMDFRNMLESLTENNEEIRRLVKRMEVISAFAEEDIEEFRENINTRLEESRERASAAKQEAVQRLTEAKENASEKKEMLGQKLERMRSSREYHRANSIMRRNSIVTTEKYREALEQLRERRK